MKLLLFGLLLILGTAYAKAQSDAADNAPSLAKKCHKGSGDALSLHEQAIYNIHKANPMADQLDPQCIGKTDSKYVGNKGEDLLASMVGTEEAKLTAQREIRIKDGGTPLPLATVKQLEAKPNMANDLGGFQIRSTLDQITTDPQALNDGDKFKTAFDKATPALFSYAYNHNTEKSTWTAKGVIAYPVLNSDRTANLVTPSIEFYKLDDGIKKDAQDSLIFRAGSTFDFDNQDTSVLSSNELRLAADYTTDFGLHKEVPGAELDYNPIFSQELVDGNENDAHLGKLLAVQWNVFLHLEGGDDLRSETRNQEYFRLGPNAELDLIPIFNPDLVADLNGAQVNGRVKIALNYFYYPNLLDGPDVSHFSAKLIGYFDKEKHFSLNLEYDIGEKAITAIQEDQYLISLGIKF
jgi:hypothetical protein